MVVVDAGVVATALSANHACIGRKNSKYELFHYEEVSKEDQQW